MRSLLFSVSLVFCLSLTGQDYKPLVVQENSFSTVIWSWGWAWTEYYFIEGDTLINSTSYARLYNSPDSLLQTEIQYIGALREDTVLKEVYFIDSPASEEHLLYRFGLNQGEQVEVYSFSGCPVQMEVQAVDTIIDEMGIARRRMIMNSFYYEKWIEGVGSNMGLISPGYYECVADIGWETLCMKNDDELFYLNPVYNSCYVFTIDIQENNKEEIQIKIIPNPVNDISRIDISDNINIVNLTVYDSFGRMVCELSVSNPTIEKERFNPGMYIIKVVTEQGKIYSCKFIVR
jgi:hypothetical protein